MRLKIGQHAELVSDTGAEFAALALILGHPLGNNSRWLDG
jgi:hypothetical protein